MKSEAIHRWSVVIARGVTDVCLSKDLQGGRQIESVQIRRLTGIHSVFSLTFSDGSASTVAWETKELRMSIG